MEQLLRWDKLDLSVEKGQICGLLGPNGAGKTTAIRMICGVLIPTSGHIEIGGLNLKGEPRQAKQLLGYVPEGAPLPTELLPIEYLSNVSSLYGLAGKLKTEAIKTWAQRCEITGVLHKPIGSLSRGFRQRVALAAALLHQPKVLILDEPSTGLDPEQRSVFHSLLRSFAQDAAVLYSSHHLGEVEQTCDDVIIINHGQLIATHSFKDVGKTNLHSIEVSSLEVAVSMNGENVTKLEDGWVRCTVNQTGENVVSLVQEFGGSVRLIQPSTQSLESKYLSLIRESNTSNSLRGQE